MIRKLLWRMWTVCTLSCAIAVICNVTTFSAGGDMGVYYGGLGAERSSDGVVALWVCDDDVSWNCPTEVEPSITARRHQRIDWQPLTIDHAIWLAMYVDGDRDWSRCEMLWVADMFVRCDDGFEVIV